MGRLDADLEPQESGDLSFLSALLGQIGSHRGRLSAAELGGLQEREHDDTPEKSTF